MYLTCSLVCAIAHTREHIKPENWRASFFGFDTNCPIHNLILIQKIMYSTFFKINILKKEHEITEYIINSENYELNINCLFKMIYII